MHPILQVNKTPKFPLGGPFFAIMLHNALTFERSRARKRPVSRLTMMRCPKCSCQIAFEKGLFRGRRCHECGATMLLSLGYVRVLMLVSFVVAQILLWVINVRQFFYPILGVPFGFLASVSLGFSLAFIILAVLVRTAPRVVEPRLVPCDPDPVTLLGLSKYP